MHRMNDLYDQMNSDSFYSIPQNLDCDMYRAI